MVHGQVYFFFDTDLYGPELWTLDDSAEGAHLVLDMWPGPGSSDARVIGTLDRKGTASEVLLLSGNDKYHGAELWMIEALFDLIPIRSVRREEGQFKFTFEAKEGKTYRIDRSTDLTAWDAASTISGMDGVIEVSDDEDPTPGRYFYRVTELEAP